MKSVFTIPTGAIVTVFDKSGKKLLDNGNIGSIEIQPFFSTSKGSAEVLKGKTVSDHRGEIEKFVLSVSGSNGKTVCRPPRTKSVVPMVDRPPTAVPAKPEEGAKA